MEALLRDILNAIKTSGQLDDKQLAKIIHSHNKMQSPDERPYAKKRLLPYYLKLKDSHQNILKNWGFNEDIEAPLLQTLQMKPRRTASGVATITVITKPWKCSSACIYCPNDVRMPKSYLSDEPACQRAERNFFDPYLQVASRLRALTHMGHATDKIELIVLGGTWSDYPDDYQLWFMTELFRALNDGTACEKNARERRFWYKSLGIENDEQALARQSNALQTQIKEGELSFNQAVEQLYLSAEPWQAAAKKQVATLEELEKQHVLNERGEHRVVGLVVETRPDTISPKSLQLLRRMGCTKVQIGVQSLSDETLEANKRTIRTQTTQRAFSLLRLFGFKIHAHFMLNLYQSTPHKDKEEYRTFMSSPFYQPDEVKLYPCSLIEGTELCCHFADGTWEPYTEDELIDVLATNTLDTPPFTRISRMIRDISAKDIMVGNKKANLRQMVEAHIAANEDTINEIRHREISTSSIDASKLRLESIDYTTTVAHEYFLQWVDNHNRIAGFLRLSLPKAGVLELNGLGTADKLGQAMIREVHVYGTVAELHKTSAGAQHLGLGKKLIDAACLIAAEKGFHTIQVISAVGTRDYYRNLGFKDGELYQHKPLSNTTY